MKKESGQILVLVLLIVVVSLAVGLSVASRNLTNLRTSTQTEQSQRSFTAAEGGVEDVLSRLSTIKTNPAVNTAAGLDVPVLVGDIQANVNVKANSTYDQLIDLGTVGQVDLGFQDSGTLQIEWVKAGDSSEYSQPASLEISLVRQLGVGGNYGQSKTFWTGGSSFSSGNECCAPNIRTPGSCSASYQKCATISLMPSSVYLRVRPFWSKTTVKVSCTAGCTLPSQTYDITSTATTQLGVTRKVQVTRTVLPSLPAVFDYALYSEGDIAK